MNSLENKKPSIKSPLQMGGTYLAWVESALIVGLWALDKSLQFYLLVTIIIIAFIFGIAISFMIVYLTCKKPWFLFNPQDYTDKAQERLFDMEMGDDQYPVNPENIESLPNIPAGKYQEKGGTQ